MIKLLTAAALLAGQAAAPPPAASPACVPRQLVGDLTIVGTSIFVSGARTLCRQHLAAGAYLLSPEAERFDTGLRAEAERRLDSAAAGLGTVLPSGAGMGPAMMVTMMRALMATGPGPEMAPLVDAPICVDLSQMIEAMSGMSPQQLGRFTTAIASIASRMEARDRERRAAAAAAAPAEPPAAPEDGEPAAEPEPEAPAPPPMPLLCPE